MGNKTTYGSDLDKIGKRYLGGKFKGVYAADKIPNLTNERPYCIINTDISTGSGEHWTSLGRINNQKNIFYDSFARDGVKLIPQLQSKRLRIINTDDDVEQDVLESNCGQRSLAFLIFLDKYGLDEAILI
jgi:hypothetical protein